MDKKHILVFKIITFYILLPAVLFLIPPQFFTGRPSLCLYKNIFGIECPGCGITRAIISLIHLEFSEALSYNKLVLLVFPLLVFIFLRSFFKDIKRVIRLFEKK